jgi:hypothetical protein
VFCASTTRTGFNEKIQIQPDLQGPTVWISVGGWRQRTHDATPGTPLILHATTTRT